MSHRKIIGFAAGIIAAVLYGTNPLGALPLYAAGVTAGNVLFYRYGLSVAVFLVWLWLRGEGVGVRWGQAIRLSLLGVLMSLSSVSLYVSFHYLDAGVASTILFTYPIMTALLMVMFFHERVTWGTTLAIVLALSGITLLYRGGDGATLSATGMLLVLLSSLLYALYIVYVNQFSMSIPPEKFTFWVVLSGWLTVMGYMLVTGETLQWLHGASWAWASLLALLPTVGSLFFINIAIGRIGSTPASILGALEPVTAVAISCTLFGEAFTPRLAAGMALILGAVVIIIVRGRA